MKKIFLPFLSLLFAVSLTAVAQEQIPEPKHWIYEQEGIPIVAPGLWWGWVQHYPESVIKMKDSAGVDVIRLEVTNTDTMQRLVDFGFQAIPLRTLGLNYIQYYTDAKYSVWEAEGTPGEVGDVTLEHNTEKTDVIPGNPSYLKLKTTAVEDTFEMIYGPYYIQDVRYYTSLGSNLDTVFYTADYDMKLEWNIPTADTNASYSSDTPICRVQVTQSYLAYAWELGCKYPIVDSVLTLGQFLQLNQWKKFSFNYTLENDSCTSATNPPPPPQYHPIVNDASLENPPLGRFAREYIEFKVIWLGNPNFLLSIDKVTIYDNRGVRMFVTDTTQVKLDIEQQADILDNYTTNVTGWLGVDEPVSIDIFEPIKKVMQILDDNSQEKRPLWLPWMGHWDGAWENRANPFGAQGKSPWVEFKKRVGRANIIQDFYMFDYPYCDTCSYNPPGIDWRVENIDIITELNYKQAYDLDPYFGASIQTGEIHNPQAEQRNVFRHEVLYNANLALIYGAKFIEVWPYFAQRSIDSCSSGYTCHGIIDFEDFYGEGPKYTDKYFMLRDTLSPRLKGLFGKTIKKLNPIEQFAGSNGFDALVDPQEAIPPYDYIEYIHAYGGPNDTCLVELGIFEDSQDTYIKYFMPLNRYYSNKYILNFGLKNLVGFYNWKVYDFVDTTNFTVVTSYNKAIFSDTISPGDAKLYSVSPVVKYGGTLAYNDTIKTGTVELIDDMEIENGVTLTINTDYVAKDTITLSGTGFISGEGYFMLQGSGEIITNTWNKSLFRSKNGNHPKIIWGEFPESGTVLGYEVHRNLQEFGWTTLASLGSSARGYTDSSHTLPTGEDLWEADYRVNVILEGSETPYYSNEIHYKINNPWGLEKGKGQITEVYEYNLFENFPNPFNPSTLIKYSIADQTDVKLVVYDILGREIKVLVSEKKEPGNYEVSFDATDLASGIYIYRMDTQNFSKTQKMVLVK